MNFMDEPQAWENLAKVLDDRTAGACMSGGLAGPTWRDSGYDGGYDDMTIDDLISVGEAFLALGKARQEAAPKRCPQWSGHPYDDHCDLPEGHPHAHERFDTMTTKVIWSDQTPAPVVVSGYCQSWQMRTGEREQEKTT